MAGNGGQRAWVMPLAGDVAADYGELLVRQWELIITILDVLE